MWLLFIYKMIQIIKNTFYKTYVNYHPHFKKFSTVSNMGNNGRLGNQLFQYAAIRAYSLKYNLPILLPIDKYNKISKFNVACRYVNKSYLENVKRVIYNEEDFIFDKKIFTENLKYDINGYFQTEKYFLHIKDLLLKELIPLENNINDYCKNYIQNLRNKFPGKFIVSLHNRRGDNVPSDQRYSSKELGVFKENKDQFHPLMQVEYFKRAKGRFSNSIFLVFSDTDVDIAWCKKHINDNQTYFSEGHDEITDLMLMKNCDHNIISNSSFSWWGAWLNENPQKKVIAPKVWFGEAYKHLDTTDLIPETWEVL